MKIKRLNENIDDSDSNNIFYEEIEIDSDLFYCILTDNTKVKKFISDELWNNLASKDFREVIEDSMELWYLFYKNKDAFNKKDLAFAVCLIPGGDKMANEFFLGYVEEKSMNLGKTKEKFIKCFHNNDIIKNKGQKFHDYLNKYVLCATNTNTNLIKNNYLKYLIKKENFIYNLIDFIEENFHLYKNGVTLKEDIKPEQIFLELKKILQDFKNN